MYVNNTTTATTTTKPPTTSNDNNIQNNQESTKRVGISCEFISYALLVLLLPNGERRGGENEEAKARKEVIMREPEKMRGRKGRYETTLLIQYMHSTRIEEEEESC